MAVFKCKMCGGDLEIAAGESVAECQYCGSKQTLPRFDSERKLNLYDRANHFRRNNEFDKAEGIYENILNEDPTDAEAYWSLVLCRYGIEYVEDPATRRRIPTVNRAQYTSVFADENYKKAVEYADALQRSIFEDEAKTIDAIQKGILEISEKEDPFDVFICYKETDAQGRRTQDSVLANELYHELTNEGFKVFFSRITLEDKLGTAYEPYIFAALHSAKVMVVLGTKPEYFNAVWVKNEWSRYLALIRAGEKKTLIPAYRDMDPYDLPEEFSHLQAQDMSKLGFMPDLIRGVKKLLEAGKPKEAEPVQPVVQQTVVQSAGGANLTAQLKRGQQALEDRDWQAADTFFDKALDIDAECAEAFFGKALAAAQCVNGESLARARLMNSATDSETLEACARDKQHIEQMVKQYAVPGYFNEERANDLFAYDKRTFQSRTKAWNERIRKEKTYWDQDRQLSRAVRYAKGELAETLKSLRGRVDAALQKSLSESEAADTNARAEVLERYQSAMEQAEEKAKQLHDEAVKRRHVDYESACEAQHAAITDEDFDKVASKFEAVGLNDYEDSKARARLCRDEAVRLRAEARKKSAEEAERKRMEREKAEAAEKAKKKKIGIVIAAIVVVVIAAVLIVTQVIIPGNKYKQAEALLAEGDYDEAIERFEALDSFKDSAAKKRVACFAKAGALLSEGNTNDAYEAVKHYFQNDEEDESTLSDCYAFADKLSAGKEPAYAAVAFGKIADYKDSRAKSLALWSEAVPQQTISISDRCAVAIRNDGTLQLACKSNSNTSEYINYLRETKNWTDLVSVYATPSSSYKPLVVLGIKEDGSVIAAGDHSRKIVEEVEAWYNIVALAIDPYEAEFICGLKIDGTVVSAGESKHGAVNVEDWRDIISIAAGSRHTIGLNLDGTVVSTVFKEHTYSNGTVKEEGQTQVNDWTDIVSIAAGHTSSLGVRADGTVVATGEIDDYGNATNWEKVIQLDGDSITAGLLSDGTVVVSGDGTLSHTKEVQSWKEIEMIDVYGISVIGITADGTAVLTSPYSFDVSEWTDIRLPNR